MVAFIQGLLAYIVSAFGDHVKEPVLGAEERQRAAEQDEEHHTAAPDVHRLPVRFPAHHLWRHEMWGANSPCKEKQITRKIKRHQNCNYAIYVEQPVKMQWSHNLLTIVFFHILLFPFPTFKSKQWNEDVQFQCICLSSRYLAKSLLYHLLFQCSSHKKDINTILLTSFKVFNAQIHWTNFLPSWLNQTYKAHLYKK